MRCAIMQPTYIPWMGYFHMMSQVDAFVFLDDVQFAKRSWQQRNRILLNHREHYLTIPVKTKGLRNQLIKETQVDLTQNWHKEHLKTLSFAYSKHPYGQDVESLMKKVIENPSDLLAEINIGIIVETAKALDIRPTFIKSSQLSSIGKKSEYLLNICEEIGAETYLSALGSKEYIEEESLFENSNIEVQYHQFHPLSYEQFGGTNFIPYMSILDAVANLGYEGVKSYVASK